MAERGESAGMAKARAVSETERKRRSGNRNQWSEGLAVATGSKVGWRRPAARAEGTRERTVPQEERTRLAARSGTRTAAETGEGRRQAARRVERRQPGGGDGRQREVMVASSQAWKDGGSGGEEAGKVRGSRRQRSTPRCCITTRTLSTLARATTASSTTKA